jgi:hypothetical protein
MQAALVREDQRCYFLSFCLTTRPLWLPDSQQWPRKRLLKRGVIGRRRTRSATTHRIVRQRGRVNGHGEAPGMDPTAVYTWVGGPVVDGWLAPLGHLPASDFCNSFRFSRQPWHESCQSTRPLPAGSRERDRCPHSPCRESWGHRNVLQISAGVCNKPGPLTCSVAVHAGWQCTALAITTRESMTRCPRWRCSAGESCRRAPARDALLDRSSSTVACAHRSCLTMTGSHECLEASHRAI